ncbi:MAG: formylglycine-generating enzyme family protein [Planctomycetota bacterium]
MHGNVEEWCHDWYGPYQGEPQTDPVGYRTGDFRVLRGGSRGTPSYYLRSANRMGQVPECKNWLMGFRVVLAELPRTQPLRQPFPRIAADTTAEATLPAQPARSCPARSQRSVQRRRH